MRSACRGARLRLGDPWICNKGTVRDKLDGGLFAQKRRGRAADDAASIVSSYPAFPRSGRMPPQPPDKILNRLSERPPRGGLSISVVGREWHIASIRTD